MKKIEKLEIPDTNAVIGLADRDGKEIEIKAIGRKINEIIDYLNQSQKEPEKQEEWREELCKICDSTSCYSISGEDYVVRATFKFEELVNFISQLLSEREKEVAMEIRGKFWEESEEDFGTYIEEKLSKLLKEGNGRE